MYAAKVEELDQERLDRKAERAAHAAEVYDLSATIEQKGAEARLLVVASRIGTCRF